MNSKFIVIIRPTFMQFCKDGCRAASFNHLLFRIAGKSKDQPREKIQAGDILWYAKSEQITEEMANAWGVCKVRKEVNALIDMGLIGRRSDPTWGANRTKHFCFGTEHCAKLLDYCKEQSICVVHLDLPPEVMHLIYSSNANDTSIKCICAIHQMETMNLSNANDTSIRAITIDSPTEIDNKERETGAFAPTPALFPHPAYPFLSFDDLAHPTLMVVSFIDEDEAELTDKSRAAIACDIGQEWARKGVIVEVREQVEQRAPATPAQAKHLLDEITRRLNARRNPEETVRSLDGVAVPPFTKEQFRASSSIGDVTQGETHGTEHYRSHSHAGAVAAGSGVADPGANDQNPEQDQRRPATNQRRSPHDDPALVGNRLTSVTQVKPPSQQTPVSRASAGASQPSLRMRDAPAPQSPQQEINADKRHLWQIIEEVTEMEFSRTTRESKHNKPGIENLLQDGISDEKLRKALKAMMDSQDAWLRTNFNVSLFHERIPGLLKAQPGQQNGRPTPAPQERPVRTRRNFSKEFAEEEARATR